MKRVRVFVCILFALILCAGCDSAPRSAQTDSPAPTDIQTPAPTPEPTAELIVTATVAPTEAPTPSPSPTPVPTPAPTTEPITLERLESGEFDSYFNDTLLIGDSLTDMLSGYVRQRRETEKDLLGNAQLFGVKGMNIKTACQDVASPGDRTYRYRGKAVSITQLINACGPKRVFVMLGVNDVADRPYETVKEQFALLIDAIHEKCPDTELVIQGVLPISKKYCEMKGVEIAYFNGFNEVLSEVCAEHGAGFLDFSKELMDENGYLAQSLSSDQQFHLSRNGEAIWIRALRLYAAQQLYPDAETVLPEN